jgi:hypothetical protein
MLDSGSHWEASVVFSTQLVLGGLMVVWSRILGIGGAVAIAVSIWSGNLVGLFGLGIVAVLVAIVMWGIGRGRQKSVN